MTRTPGLDEACSGPPHTWLETPASSVDLHLLFSSLKIPKELEAPRQASVPVEDELGETLGASSGKRNGGRALGAEAGWPVGHWAQSRAWGPVSGSGDAGLVGERGSGFLVGLCSTAPGDHVLRFDGGRFPCV